MARDGGLDAASLNAAQSQVQSHSKRPPLSSRASDSHSDTTSSAPSQQHHTRPKQQHHSKPHHGRIQARVHSTKALHKQHAPNSRSTRRQPSPPDQDSMQRPPHRRAISEFKPQRQAVSSNLPKSASHTNLKRNRSSIDISKRTQSTDKLKRTSSGSGINHKSNKSQVHFDLGNEDDDDQDAQDDEWVDASASNSPYMSRKGSLNSSAQSSLKPGPHSNNNSRNNSRPETPNEPKLPSSTPEADKERNLHKEYITSRLLDRVPSRGAPPQMTEDVAQATPSQSSPVSTDIDSPPPSASNGEGLTSRFVDVPSSGLTSEGSFYHRGTASSRRSEDTPRRPTSVISLSQSHGSTDGVPATEEDNSALVPKTTRRTTSRTQQKLNLQRASSAIEPGPTVARVVGIATASPLIGVGGPGHDGGNSRDPRVGRLLDRTGMEYLVVRRYQNPVARSLTRLARRSQTEKSKRIPRPSSGVANGRRTPEPLARHVRNVSMPDPRQALASKRSATTVRTNGTGSSFDGDDVSRLGERLSGSSLVGGEEEDDLASLLRNMWDKPLDLSASAD